jgi:glutamate racemase
LSLTLPILTDMAGRCQVIVIACNTLTTNCIDQLRAALPVPLVGLEPMVKPAAARSISGVIAVCATPATLRSPRYAYLKATYAADVMIIEPDCSRWAGLIQTNRVDRQTISIPIEAAIGQGADVIVLGCTHYHWIEELVRELADGRAEVMQPEQAVATQLGRVLASLSD